MADAVYLGITPEGVVEMLQAEGLQAQLESADGEPLIQAATSGRQFMVLFYGDQHEGRFGSVQFWAGFRDGTFTTDQLNLWNRKRRFAKAWLDEERDPHLEMDLVTVGITREFFAFNLRLWSRALAEF